MNFALHENFHEILLHDSGSEDPEHFLIFGTTQLLDGLARAELWLADGTFKTVPSIFFQLYTIHFQSDSGRNPAAVYALLPNKTRSTYSRMLSVIKEQIPTADPTCILLDFEMAAMSTFNEFFPDANIKGCFFHLSQSVIRKANQLGMKSDIESNIDFSTAVLCLPALSYVPSDCVVEAFELLADSMPHHDHMDELISFFEHTYIRGRRRGNSNSYPQPLFPIAQWNHFDNAVDGIARTTNAVEGWHYALQCLFQCSHPTMWTFLNGILADIGNQKYHFLQGISGAVLPPLRKYERVKQNVQRVVGQFGATDIITYLKAVQYLACK